MNKEKTNFIKIICIVLLSVLFISIILMKYLENHKSKLQTKIVFLENKIKQEQKDILFFKQADKNILTSSYFKRSNENSEDYIRDILKKFDAEIHYYNSKKNINIAQNKYSISTIGFTITPINFFNLIKAYEDGRKVVQIKSILLKSINLFLRVEFVVKVFYE